jgi:hypothetical protein
MVRLVLVALLLVPALAHAQARRVAPQATTETIGTWLLACAADPLTDKGQCTLRHRLWLEEPRGGDAPRPGLALEVLTRPGGISVPALVARDLTLDSARLGMLGLVASAQVRFGREPAMDFPCGLEGRMLVCAPRPDAAEVAAAQLLNASTMLARLPQNPLTGSGGEPLALDLAETREAVRRFRARMPEPPPPEPAPQTGLQGQFDRLMEQFRRALPPAPQ